MLLDKEEAEVRLERLDQVIHEFQGIQRQIIDEIDEPTEADITAEVEFEERSLTLRATLRRVINNEKEENVRTTETDGVLMQLLQRLSDGAAEGVIGGNRVKLPTIKLPSFDGRIEEWTRFHDSFMKTIHNNPTLPSIQKFIYLRSCVSGAAASAIEDIELSDDNYMVAWEQLKGRFEDSGIIKRRHVQCLFEMPLVVKDKASALLHLIDHVNKHLRVLKRLGAPTDSWGDLLLHMVEGKLDRATLRAWEERSSIQIASTSNSKEVHRDSNFNELMEFLNQRSHALERIESSNAKINADNNKNTSKG